MNESCLLCFQNLSESCFSLALYTEEVNLQTFVIIYNKTICCNYLCTKNFYSSHWFLKNQIFSLFHIVKMNANYAEIYRVGNLETDFQQVPLVQFSETFTILL